jgi:hypothetical protein
MESSWVYPVESGLMHRDSAILPVREKQHFCIAASVGYNDKFAGGLLAFSLPRPHFAS